MNKTNCMKCGKEIEYSGFCCPTYCWECANKELANTDVINIRQYVTSKLVVSIPCLICQELIELAEYEPRDSVKVCDKCKKAVMKMRGEDE